MIYLLLALAAVGHVIFWSAAVNRLHGLGIDRRWIDLATYTCAALLALLPPAVIYVLWRWGPDGAGSTPLAARAYLYFMAAWCAASALHRIWMTLHPERRGVVRSNHSTAVKMRAADNSQYFAQGVPRMLGRIPGNQAVALHVHRKRIVVPRMPPGRVLRLAHISDLHMSGRIGKSYFEEVTDAVNELEPDLIAISGDLVERDQCLDWVPDTLGRLRASAGVYFVLGNHDLCMDYRRLLRMLDELGLVYLGGTWQQISVGGTPLVVAGNEVPWLSPPTDPAKLPARGANNLPLRICLAHGPDQIAWASRGDFDLMLAGHNHGGQVRLPLFGALLAPSISGVRYAGGTYRRCNTVLHVSRGTSSLTPLRWNCRPEIALLELGN